MQFQLPQETTEGWGRIYMYNNTWSKTMCSFWIGWRFFFHTNVSNPKSTTNFTFFSKLRNQFDRLHTYSTLIHPVWGLQVRPLIHSSDIKVLPFHDYIHNLHIIINSQNMKLSNRNEINGWSVWLEKSKFTNFQRPQLNYAFLFFRLSWKKGLWNGRKFSTSTERREGPCNQTCQVNNNSAANSEGSGESIPVNQQRVRACKKIMYAH